MKNTLKTKQVNPLRSKAVSKTGSVTLNWLLTAAIDASSETFNGNVIASHLPWNDALRYL